MKTVRIAQLAAIAVVTTLLELTKAPTRPEDIPLENSFGGKMGGYIAELFAATLIVMILFFIGKGILALARRWRR